MSRTTALFVGCIFAECALLGLITANAVDDLNRGGWFGLFKVSGDVLIAAINIWMFYALVLRDRIARQNKTDA